MDKMKRTYNSDKLFLQKYVEVVELSHDKARVLISPTLQGRVVTSSPLDGNDYSFGWINYDLISSGKFLPHCNNFGGEDRYWIGPEGGQYSIFFKKGSTFGIEDWQTPSVIDTESWKLVKSQKDSAILTKSMTLENYSGFNFNLKADREVLLLGNEEVSAELNLQIPDAVSTVGFKSINRMTNTGDFPWNEETGMLSIWILGQFIPSAGNMVILPFREEAEGEIVNDSYFGKIDQDRMKLLPGAVLFKGDGLKRGKIGIGPERAKSVIGSIDRVNNTLTLVKFSFKPSEKQYINSMWEWQKEPFRGDVVNSYNDGPLPDGTIMGPFYELETSSPAAKLKPNESLVHEHATFHFAGEINQLEKMAEEMFGSIGGELMG